MSAVRFQLRLGDQLATLMVSDGVLPLLGFSAEDFNSGKIALRERFHADDADIAELVLGSPWYPVSTLSTRESEMRPAAFSAFAGSSARQSRHPDGCWLTLISKMLASCTTGSEMSR